jgi:hypothetical protein
MNCDICSKPMVPFRWLNHEGEVIYGWLCECTVETRDAAQCAEVVIHEEFEEVTP